MLHFRSYRRNVSDKKLTVKCRMLKLYLETQQLLIIVLPPGVSLNISPRLNETGQLTENECTTMRKMALVHIHVERAIERIKNCDSFLTICTIVLIKCFLYVQ